MGSSIDVKGFVERRLQNFFSRGHPYLADVAAAASAAVCVSPLVTMIDKAVMENASGRCNIWVSLGKTLKDMVLRPHQFARKPEFLLVTSVYFITYGTANTLDTNGKNRAEARARMERRATVEPAYVLPAPSLLAQYVSPSTIQLLGTTFANMSSSMIKDSILAKMFGSGPVRSFPLASYGSFFCRDVVTIAAGFTIPGPLAVVIQEHSSMPKASCEVAAQLLCPLSMQFICTPVHLLGLDYYNRPDVSFQDRARFIGGQFRTVLPIRMARMLPAFGFGGLGNKYFRRVYKEGLAARFAPAAAAP